MDGQEGLSPQFTRSLVAMEEARAQYRADHERALADDETRQAEFAKLVEENRARSEQLRAEREAAGTESDPATSKEAELAAIQAAEAAEDGAIFQFEDEAAVEAPPQPVVPAFRPPAAPVAPQAPARPAARHRASEVDDDFSATNWVDDH
ncbi:hypothetical protein ABZU76_32055 [Amycolatopsis sp. NPDC005232]|uniref:hypothetical protein n=1 Tax=Amycolatopsis sp. NPDC005232 TaxID=3157027 RepID=UPI0033B24AD3